MKGVAYGKFRRRAQIWQKDCDQENRILWPVFGQNNFFQTRQSWISIPGTCLSCWHIHVPSTRCIKRCEQQKYDLEQGGNWHTQTQLKWRSLCAPLDIVLLLPLFFFSIFGLSLFSWNSLTFSCYFFIFFILLGAQKK